ncbi:MAG: tRNA lysidine(34) synthetase TilS [Bacilli bacterium]|nr:tRNA lysidine(34) synthetase TilS [Bacilli bacterium]
MEKHLVSFFKKHNLILENKTIAIAVSTGVDSMALLACMNNLKTDFNLKIHIVHVNHGKRKESLIEEEYIKDYAKANNLDIHIMHLEANNEVNFQSYAREKRYDFFYKVIRQVKADYLMLAHHANDNMETIMMRLIRGSSLKGYSGMIEVNQADGFYILRPFLNILKDELIDYINLHKIKYYEDISNDDDLYTRNRIRKDLIPIIFNEDANAHLKFIEFANTINEAAKIVEEKVAVTIKDYEFSNNSISFSASKFLEESDYLKEEILFTLLKKYDLSKANIFEIIKLIKSKKKNLKVEFKKRFTIVKEYDKITIFNYLLEIQDFRVIIDEIKTYNINDTIQIIVSKTGCNYIPSKEDLWYNSNMLPVVMRRRIPGDKILLEGGYKKVKDLLIDLKLGILERDNVLILEKDSEVLAVIGIRKSVKLKNIENNDIIINVRSKYNG